MIESTAMTVARWIVDGSVAADYTSGWINCRDRSRLDLWITVAATTDPVGVLYVQGSLLGPDGSVGLSISLEKMFTTDPTTVVIDGSDDRKITITDPADAVTIWIPIWTPPAFTRIFYDSTSGGAATGLSAGYVIA
jgi:hypothetical protein